MGKEVGGEDIGRSTLEFDSLEPTTKSLHDISHIHLQRARNIELDRFVRVYIMNTCVGLVWFACPVLVTVVSFLWYTKVEGHELTARLVITIFKKKMERRWQ